VATLRLPPPLMGVVSQNAGRGASGRDATQALAIDEIEPKQARLLQINEWLSQAVIRITPFEMHPDNGN